MSLIKIYRVLRIQSFYLNFCVYVLELNIVLILTTFFNMEKSMKSYSLRLTWLVLCC